MISAFGVEHGEISKGLPQGMSLSTNYGRHRTLAHNSGKAASRLMSREKNVARMTGRPNKSIDNTYGAGTEKRAGQAWRKQSYQGFSTGKQNPRRVLP
jgi:hypothetical protein